MRSTALVLLLAAGLFSCKSKGYDKTDSGLQYKMYTHKEGEKAKVGDYIKINMVNKTDNDSVLTSTYKMGKPITLLVEKPNFNGDLMEGFTLMAEGDSATFLISVDSLAQGNPLPPFLKSGTNLKFDVTMVDIMSEEEYKKEMQKAQMDQMQKAQETINQEASVIEDYLKKNNLTAQKSPSGVYYIIEKQGSGPMPAPGDTVSVNYRGKLLSGQEFDNSYDRGQPISFPLGQGRVIPGWEEGIALFKKGGKGKLIIPSPLGYGSHDMGNIPPNSILVFDIELVDVK